MWLSSFPPRQSTKAPSDVLIENPIIILLWDGESCQYTTGWWAHIHSKAHKPPMSTCRTPLAHWNVHIFNTQTLK